MKKISIFAVAIAAMAFTSCGGNKSAQTAEETDSIKAFEQEQVEAKIKLELDSLAAEVGRLKNLPIVQSGENGVQLTAEEKQVKPDYLLAPSVSEDATTLAEKYRVLSALSVDKTIAKLYEMPTEEYEAAITKLAADIDDPSFKALDNTGSIFETSQALYDAMNKNARINYFWQIASAALVEQLYIVSQNKDKFLSTFTDEAAANVTFRIILILDATNRLSLYDPEIQPVAEAITPLEHLNATTVDELKAQMDDMKDEIEAARKALVK